MLRGRRGTPAFDALRLHVTTQTQGVTPARPTNRSESDRNLNASAAAHRQELHDAGFQPRLLPLRFPLGVQHDVAEYTLARHAGRAQRIRPIDRR
jgi:hypothetical protein